MKTYKAIFFDWDGTAVGSRTADATAVLKAMENLLLKGIRLIIVSGTTYENICGGKLEEKMSKEALSNLYLGLGRGCFQYGFDEKGKRKVLQDNTPSIEGTLKIHDAVYKVHQTLLKDYSLPTDIVFSRPNYCKIDLMVSCKRSADSQFLQTSEVEKINSLLEEHEIKGGLSKLLQISQTIGTQFEIPLKATTDAKYLEIGTTTKADNVNWFMNYFKDFGIQIEDCCFWGDEFGAIYPKIWGSDAQMITEETKKGDFFDVSNSLLPLPIQVKDLGGGTKRFIDFLKSLADDCTELPNRILIIVPHSDDEVLLSAGLMHRALNQGKEVFVAVVTNGDYLCEDYSKGVTRLQESKQALLELGVISKNIYFLGYPDTGMEEEVSFLARLKNTKSQEKIFPSSCAQETYGISEEFPDYCYRRTGKHASYNRLGLETDLQELLEETKPNLVLTTSCFDLHGDHSALSWFVRNALIKMKKQKGESPVLWEGIVHSPAGDEIWPKIGEENKPFSKIPELEISTDLVWENRISIETPESFKDSEQRNQKKKELILSYKTAFSEEDDAITNYLTSFAKSDEIFWKIEI